MIVVQRATALAAVIVLAFASPARADENGAIYQAVHDFCIKGHASVDAAARAALEAPFQRRDHGTDKGPPHVREAGWLKLGGSTIVNFAAPPRKAAPTECRFVSYSDDLAALLERMKDGLALSEPVQLPMAHNGWRKSGSVALSGRPRKVALDYFQQDNRKSGSFRLAVDR